jgi:hypothetical protein
MYAAGSINFLKDYCVFSLSIYIELPLRIAGATGNLSHFYRYFKYYFLSRSIGFRCLLSEKLYSIGICYLCIEVIAGIQVYRIRLFHRGRVEVRNLHLEKGLLHCFINNILLPVCAHFKLLKQMKTRTTLLHL